MSERPRSSHTPKSGASGVGAWVMNVFLILIALGMIAPIVWMVSASLRPTGDLITTPPSWLPIPFEASHYAKLASSQFPVHIFFKNSLLVSTLSTLGLVLTSSLAGYAFAKLRFRGREILFAALLLALMIPVQVTAVPLYIIMQRLNLIDSPWALIVPALLGAFAPGLPGAFGIFMMRQFFRNTPDALIEAARLDGASHLRVFFQIALPLAKPALAALAMITFVFSWNSYFEPLIFLNSPENMTLAVGIQSLRPAHGLGDNTLVMAAVSVAMIPLLIAFMFGQRWIVGGFARSGMNE